jgi:hypothetical protein
MADSDCTGTLPPVANVPTNRCLLPFGQVRSQYYHKHDIRHCSVLVLCAYMWTFHYYGGLYMWRYAFAVRSLVRSFVLFQKAFPESRNSSERGLPTSDNAKPFHFSDNVQPYLNGLRSFVHLYGCQMNRRKRAHTQKQKKSPRRRNRTSRASTRNRFEVCPQRQPRSSRH